MTGVAAREYQICRRQATHAFPLTARFRYNLRDQKIDGGL